MKDASPPSEPPSGMDGPCVAQTLRRATRLVTRRYEDALRPVGLTASQFTILRALSQVPRIPQGKMADALGFEATTLTRLLKPMVARGWIVIVPDPRDRRGRVVSPTEAGRALYDEATVLWREAQTSSLERLEAGEFEALRASLSRLSD